MSTWVRCIALKPVFLVAVLRSGKIHRFEKGKSVSLQVVFWPLSLDKIQRNGVTLLHATSSVVLRRTSALSSIPEPNDYSNFVILIWKWWVVRKKRSSLARFTYMRICFLLKFLTNRCNYSFTNTFHCLTFFDLLFWLSLYLRLFYFSPKIDKRDTSYWFKTIPISRELLIVIDWFRSDRECTNFGIFILAILHRCVHVNECYFVFLY